MSEDKHQLYYYLLKSLIMFLLKCRLYKMFHVKLLQWMTLKVKTVFIEHSQFQKERTQLFYKEHFSQHKCQHLSPFDLYAAVN